MKMNRLSPAKAGSVNLGTTLPQVTLRFTWGCIMSLLSSLRLNLRLSFSGLMAEDFESEWC
jgi:hypothetical protein